MLGGCPCLANRCYVTFNNFFALLIFFNLRELYYQQVSNLARIRPFVVRRSPFWELQSFFRDRFGKQLVVTFSSTHFFLPLWFSLTSGFLLIHQCSALTLLSVAMALQRCDLLGLIRVAGYSDQIFRWKGINSEFSWFPWPSLGSNRARIRPFVVRRSPRWKGRTPKFFSWSFGDQATRTKYTFLFLSSL